MSQRYLWNLPVTGEEEHVPFWGLGEEEERETEPDVTTELINSEGAASGGEQHIGNTIMAEWVKDW